MKQTSSYPGSLILKQDRSLNAQFVKTGQRPQNFIKNVNPSQRYNKYPKPLQLMQQKKLFINTRNHPAVYMKADLKNFQLSQLGKFDVIYFDPPWKQYETRARKLNLYNGKKIQHYKSWSLQQLMELKIQDIADTTCFMFLWVGSQHLDDGRQLFKKWNFKRCQDIVWAKTNFTCPHPPPVGINTTSHNDGVFIRVKQHCLVGYKGQSKRASDHTIVHPNIDIDVVITQQPQLGSLSKPIQVYQIIQRFCLGRKKIQLFGNDTNIRNGWFTVGNQIQQNKFNKSQYQSWFQGAQQLTSFKGGRKMGTTPIIQSLRPRQDIKNQDDAKRSVNTK